MQDCALGLKARGICVIIPTFNNAGTIVDVVSRAQKYCTDVFVVSDGCTDDTLNLIEGMSPKPDVVVLKTNSGKGSALKAGFKYALSRGFSYAITLDADGQHYPEDIPLFLETSRKHPGALIVGRRQGLKDAVRSKASRFANGFSNLWFFLQTLCPLQDTQTGCRLYPLRKLHGLNLLTSRYEAELELLVFAAWGGVRIRSLDVNVYYPPREERVSHFRPVKDFTRISILNTVLCILALFYGLPRTVLRQGWRILMTIFIFLSYILGMMLIVNPYLFLYIKCRKMTPERKEGLHRRIQKVAKTATAYLRLSGVSHTIHNESGEDFSKPSVIICNHQSHLDLIGMLALTPKMTVLTADWVWNNPLYGFIIHSADFLPASRGVEAIVPKLRELVEQGYSIAIYPEGTRSKDCSIGRFHQGAFHLASLLNLDILPLTLYGAGNALPKHGRILTPWPIHLEVGHRITPSQMELYGETPREKASAMRKYYKSHYREYADSIEKDMI